MRGNKISSKNGIQNRIKDSLWDLIVVAVGIIIAIQADNLREYILSKDKEKTILTQIKRGLKKDIDDINFNINGHTIALNSDSVILDCIKYKLPFREELIYHFPNTLLDFIFITNTGAYETLKSIGMDLIKDDSLQLSIAEIYDSDYEKLHKFEEEFYPTQSYNRFFVYFSKNFKFYKIPWNTVSSVCSCSAYPIDYTNLINDTEYEIILQNDILWRKLFIDRYNKMSEKANILISMIDKELEK